MKTQSWQQGCTLLAQRRMPCRSRRSRRIRSYLRKTHPRKAQPSANSSNSTSLRKSCRQAIFLRYRRNSARSFLTQRQLRRAVPVLPPVRRERTILMSGPMTGRPTDLQGLQARQDLPARRAAVERMGIVIGIWETPAAKRSPPKLSFSINLGRTCRRGMSRRHNRPTVPCCRTCRS